MMAKRVAQPTNGGTTGDDEIVVFEYIKSQFFRVIHADGAIGGITPHGNIHFALYSDRGAIPRALVYRRGKDGSIGEQLADQTVVRPGVIREMDVDVVLSSSAAESLHSWLGDRLKELADRREKIKQAKRTAKGARNV
jgi:hypothetical protein